jgi:hypothetical protein
MLKNWNGTAWVETDTPTSDVTVTSQTPPSDTTVNWEDDSPLLTPAEQAIATATANLQNLVGQLAPSLAQAQDDLVTLSSSTDPLAPIFSRTIQGVVMLAQGLSDALISLQLIATNEQTD